MSTRVVLEADDDGHVRKYEVLYPLDADIWQIAELLHYGLLALGYQPEVIAKVLTIDDEESGGTSG